MFETDESAVLRYEAPVTSYPLGTGGPRDPAGIFPATTDMVPCMPAEEQFAAPFGHSRVPAQYNEALPSEHFAPHWPDWQDDTPPLTRAHALPHFPQFVALVSRFEQLASHREKPSEQLPAVDAPFCLLRLR
ncbi:hypothetical protein M427DRAFT_59258 [Gonapodya prolifera JEL478]|uniref:Uncharacterized protein n=1 Tax=Gonapodya prolifera (strain JEL478) TaxID=1344416 RepID=A0A139A7G0_GONPJ|nr:hypothetical protein M427DRAFT_59258 [Gonapodya prolifera JEL478]|eukprot:KXS12736.1 hypothetical protein M427DRAFT_59258 [Gonapodya prolifera JEL478]